jgi:hypothetical protein
MPCTRGRDLSGRDVTPNSPGRQAPRRAEQDVTLIGGAGARAARTLDAVWLAGTTQVRPLRQLPARVPSRSRTGRPAQRPFLSSRIRLRPALSQNVAEPARRGRLQGRRIRSARLQAGGRTTAGTGQIEHSGCPAMALVDVAGFRCPRPCRGWRWLYRAPQVTCLAPAWLRFSGVQHDEGDAGYPGGVF